MTRAVELHDITRRFGDVTAVDHISLDVEAGEVFGLVGPNGAGKTTIIRMCCGLYAPTHGTAVVLGFDLAHDRSRVRREVGYVSQRFSLYDELTVAENVRFFADVYGNRGHVRAGELVARLDLDDIRGTRVAALPTGVRQRVALAAALVHEPRLVFLDEPTSGMDPVAREAVWAMIRRLARDGLTVVVTTHHMSEARHCDRLALLAAGRVVAAGPPADLVRASGIQVVRISSRPWQEAYRRCKTRWPAATGLHGRTVHVTTPAPEAVRAELPALLDGLEVRSVDVAAPTMEDTFVELVRRVTVP